MPRPELERTVQQSVLDRLIDQDPGVTADPPTTLAQSTRQFKAAVRRDLEWLLNTRRIATPAPDTFDEVPHSLYHYGLPDVTSLSADSPESRLWLLNRIEETIAMFEPRLTGVRVSLSETRADGGRELRFLIEATLRMDPNPEQVVFDTVLELGSGAYQVAGASSA